LIDFQQNARGALAPLHAFLTCEGFMGFKKGG